MRLLKSLDDRDLPGFCFQLLAGFPGLWNDLLAYAMLIVVLNLLLLWPLYSERIRVRF